MNTYFEQIARNAIREIERISTTPRVAREAGVPEATLPRLLATGDFKESELEALSRAQRVNMSELLPTSAKTPLTPYSLWLPTALPKEPPMTLSDAMRYVREIATNEGLQFSKRQLRTRVVYYPN
ncbi:hypothetical protein [Dermabacter jinjuensis]|nr:hypothetical protein [Dermabacter jinjuensis]UEB90098.1 hypothetical protein LK448_00895 [Dermabacter jinjuensis]